MAWACFVISAVRAQANSWPHVSAEVQPESERRQVQLDTAWFEKRETDWLEMRSEGAGNLGAKSAPPPTHTTAITADKTEPLDLKGPHF